MGTDYEGILIETARELKVSRVELLKSVLTDEENEAILFSPKFVFTVMKKIEQKAREDERENREEQERDYISGMENHIAELEEFIEEMFSWAEWHDPQSTLLDYYEVTQLIKRYNIKASLSYRGDRKILQEYIRERTLKKKEAKP